MKYATQMEAAKKYYEDTSPTDKNSCSMCEKIATFLVQIKDKAPLIHHITNYVTVNDCANVTLAIGASPIMADGIEEVEEITAISQALVLNIGTLNETAVQTMILSGQKANAMSIPVVLDPVGAGASGFRSKTVKKLLEQVSFDVIRGNMSEIRFIAGLNATTKGVDASKADLNCGTENGIATAKSLADKLGCVIAITGVTDIISNGKDTVLIENGHEMLSAVTGTGCMCSALIGSSCGAGTDYFAAAAAGIMFMGIAGEIAFENVGKKGNGSFHIDVINEISRLNSETVRKRAKIYEA